MGGTLSPGQIVPGDGHLLEQRLHGGDAAVVVAGAQQVLLPVALQLGRLMAELQPGVAQPAQLRVLGGVLAARQPAHALRHAGQHALLGVQLLPEVLDGRWRVTTTTVKVVAVRIRKHKRCCGVGWAAWRWWC